MGEGAVHLLTAIDPVASHLCRDAYPVLARQLQVLPSLSLSSLSLHQARHLSELVWLLEPAIFTAVSSTDCAIPWALISSLVAPLLSSLSCWLGEAEEGGTELVLERLVCVRALLHTIASFFSSQTGAKVRDASSSSSSSSSSSCSISLPSSCSNPMQVQGQPVELLEQAEALASPSGLLVRLAHSSLLSTSLDALRQATPTASHTHCWLLVLCD